VLFVLVGSLTLTKIKLAFSILKKLVIEARANTDRTPGDSRNVPGIEGTGPADSSDLARQVKDLQSCLLQRDNEIAILVNMVKKGKTIDDGSAGGGGSRSMDDSSRGESREDFAAQSKQSSSSNRGARGRGEGLAEVVAKPSREEIIIKRHLYGVPPPEDKAVFDDMSRKICLRLLLQIV
jgi:hypothetical protein